jgi:hypothetical protein
MSATGLPGTRVTALHAVRLLARYERHVRRMSLTWLDMDLYHTVSAEVDAIGLACAQLPGVKLPWVALLVSHAELVHTLWRTGTPPSGPPGGSTTALEEHLHCIDALARRCVRLAGLGTLQVETPSGVT